MSDLSEEYEFSQYKELNQLDKKSKVVVVQDIRDNRIWVRKNIEKRSLPVCEKMLGKKYSNLVYLHKIIKYQNNYYSFQFLLFCNYSNNLCKKKVVLFHSQSQLYNH